MVLPLRGGGRVGRRQLYYEMSNVQYPMINFEIGYSTLDILHFARRCFDACNEDRHELVAFASRRLRVLRAEVHSAGKLQPRLGFAQLLQADLQLMQEVLA